MLNLLLYADDLESLGVGPSGRKGIPLSYCYMSLLAFPFKSAKTRGGFRVEWLGMEMEYNTKRRADWLVSWLRATVKSGSVTARDMAQGLGRLGFAAIALGEALPGAAIYQLCSGS